LTGLASSIWRAQLNALSDPTPPPSDIGGGDDGDGSSDDEFARELAAEMAAAAPEALSEAQDAAELDALRRGGGAGQSTGAGVGGQSRPGPAAAGAAAGAGAAGAGEAVVSGRRKKTKRVRKVVLRKTSWEEEGGVMVKKVEEFESSDPRCVRNR
jgi:hypothetical protein